MTPSNVPPTTALPIFFVSTNSLTPLDTAVIPKSAYVKTVPNFPNSFPPFATYFIPLPNNPVTSPPSVIYLPKLSIPVTFSNSVLTIVSTGLAISEIPSKIFFSVPPLFPNDSYQAMVLITPFTNFLRFVPLSTDPSNSMTPSDCRKALVKFFGVSPSIWVPLLNQSLSEIALIASYKFIVLYLTPSLPSTSANIFS